MVKPISVVPLKMKFKEGGQDLIDYICREIKMMAMEKDLIPDYDWEVESCCARCGSIHYLIFDEESKKFYCGPCLQLIHQHKKLQPVIEIPEEDDFCL
jgi:hypothetical protein